MLDTFDGAEVAPVTFDSDFQLKAVTMFLRDSVFAQRVSGLLEPKYFDDQALAYLIDTANRHFEQYKQAPTGMIVAKAIREAKEAKILKEDFVAELSDRLGKIYSKEADLSNSEWTADRVSEFAKQRAVEAAIEEAIGIIEKRGDFSMIEQSIKKAMSVGAIEGTGSVNYGSNLKARIARRAEALKGGVSHNAVTTGHREIDELLYHRGWGKKEMAILMGGAKSGKSTALQWFALQAYKAGKNVLYATLENSKEVTQDRMDAAIAGIPLRDLDTAAFAIEQAVLAIESKGGRLDIEEFAGGTCRPSDLRRLIDKRKSQGIVYDLLVVDYADEMAPERRHQDERFASKEVYQGLRAIGIDYDMAILTATQTNRAGNKAATPTATDVAEDFNKVRLADVLISIAATEDEKKNGQLRLYFAAMRNSESGLTVTAMCDRSRQQFITKILSVS